MVAMDVNSEPGIQNLTILLAQESDSTLYTVFKPEQALPLLTSVAALSLVYFYNGLPFLMDCIQHLVTTGTCKQSSLRQSI